MPLISRVYLLQLLSNSCIICDRPVSESPPAFPTELCLLDIDPDSLGLSFTFSSLLLKSLSLKAQSALRLVSSHFLKMLMNKGKGQASLNRGEWNFWASHLLTGRKCILVPSGKVCIPVMKHIGHRYICLTCCLSETEVFLHINCIKCTMIPLFCRISITILNPRWKQWPVLNSLQSILS